MRAKYRPFINIWEHLPSEFNELIKTLMVLIRQGENVGAQQRELDSIENFKHLLSGWKRAQVMTPTY